MPRDTDDSNTTRRRFLKATGAAALTSAVAGCGNNDGGTDTPGGDGGDGGDGGGDGGDGGSDGGDGGDGTDTGPVNVDGYPYGAGETLIEEAQQVMEDAGYGPDNRFELDWLQYTSPTWSEAASIIQDRLSEAYIDMNRSDAAFSPLLEATRNGNHQAYTLGWVADYPGPQNFLQLVNPPNTDYTQEPRPNGARLFWTEDANADSEVRQFMVDQFQRILDNPENSDEDQQIRDEATTNIEEGMWQEAVLIPMYQSVGEPMWYDHVEYNPYGVMDSSRQKTSNAVESIEGKDRLAAISGTMNQLDPAASGNTESGSKVLNMFDALLNYRNGTTEVEPLVAEDYEVSDDFTTYTFQLKENIQFHNGDELTADDVVYSFQRLMASPNSTNTSFPNEVLNIQHETEEGSVVLDSIGVEATGDYEVEISLDSPFAFALEVLAYSAFSILPEGIVGDIDGYDGEMSWDEFTQAPVGCGPFEFSNWESGNGGSMALDTFDDYHGDGASFDGIDYAILSEAEARYNYFINQNADVGGVPTSQYDASLVNIESTDDRGREHGTYGPLENDETVNTARVPQLGTYYIGFNLQEVPKAVRQAMAYVINQPEFMETAWKTRFQAAYHLTPPQIFPGGQEAYDQHVQGGGD